MMSWRVAGPLTSFALFFTQIANAEEPKKPAGLPPVPVSELTGRAPQPSWDTGIIAAVCGVGEPGIWQTTKFCLGGMADVLWGREEESESAWGGYAQVSTAGFRDAVFSLGGAFQKPLGEWLSAEFRAGPLMRLESHPAWGAQGIFEIGQRSFSYKSRYSLSHALLLGVDFTAKNSQLPANTTLWVGIRVDAYWLTAPAMLLQL
jgi:hypothetical protein